MKLIPTPLYLIYSTKRTTITPVRYKITSILDEFRNSSDQAVKIEFSPEEFRHSHSAQASFISCINLHPQAYAGIKCIVRGGDLYLIKTYPVYNASTHTKED